MSLIARRASRPFGPIAPQPKEFLTREQCQALFDNIVALSTGGGDTSSSISSQWVGGSTWARNRMHYSTDIHRFSVGVGRSVHGAGSGAGTTRIDDAALREMLQRAELSLTYQVDNPEAGPPEKYQDQEISHPILWSEETYAFDVGKRTKVAQSMMEASDTAGLMSAGTLLTRAQAPAVLNTTGLFRYYPVTEVECSMTVRDKKGTASGWAGINHYAIEKIDPMKIAAIAYDKCVKSMNPVFVEPGRYVAILEPQATADFFNSIIGWLDRSVAEQGMGPFTNGPGTTKIGERVLDPQLMLSADPMAPDAGFIPFDQGSGEAYREVDWINDGILKELAYGRGYAKDHHFSNKLGLPNSGSYTLHAKPGTPLRTVDEMIATTQRGLLVTRFWGVEVVDNRSMMSTGYTRDGLWLVENGKVKSAVKNFRITYSPLFALNNLEQVGAPVRVFRPGTATLAPPVRVRDFNFSSLADAI